MNQFKRILKLTLEKIIDANYIITTSISMVCSLLMAVLEGSNITGRIGWLLAAFWSSVALIEELKSFKTRFKR